MVSRTRTALLVGAALTAAAGVFVNVIFMVLNLLPLPPLDGGRILPDSLVWAIARFSDAGKLASVCDLDNCRGEVDEPACVYACPHDAARRVDQPIAFRIFADESQETRNQGNRKLQQHERREEASRDACRLLDPDLRCALILGDDIRQNSRGLRLRGAGDQSKPTAATVPRERERANRMRRFLSIDGVEISKRIRDTGCIACPHRVLRSGVLHRHLLCFRS